MEIALSLVALVLVVVGVAGAAGRVGIPAPLLLVGVGVVGGYLPFVPDIELEPELVLVGLLPPLLYAAAIRTSLVDFRANRMAIGLLSVGATLFTTVVVAVIAWWVIPPPFSIAAAFALGAVVAPPDAVAATAVARRIGMPRRIVAILEGESLVNDATALVALNTARTAIVTSIGVWAVVRDFAVAAVGGVLIGLAVGWAVAYVRRRVDDPVLDTSISFVAPFLAFIAAENKWIHASGVLAVVVTGLMLGHQAHRLQSGASRLAEQSTWRTLQFLLENTVFLLIGLQLPVVVDAARQDVGGGSLLLISLVVLAAVLGSRFIWVFGTYGLRRLNRRPSADGWTARTSIVVSWAGMRGVVSIAAAFALPEDTPRRGLLLFAAFVVVVGTLVLQGLSLPWLTRQLRLPGPDPAEDALAEAALLHEVARAGGDRLDAERTDADPEQVVAQLRVKVQQRADQAWERLGRSHTEYEPPTAAYLRLRLAMIESERQALVAARDSGRYDDDVLRSVATMLDVEESLLDRSEVLARPVDGTRLAPARSVQHCEHLEQAPTAVQPSSLDGCEDCLREGITWVHLRLCLTCGYVGCCDTSPRQHATAHFHDAQHPVMRSFEPHEYWRWCFVDEVLG
ncbi:MAG: Na+/H+ antiporter [Angustibacter sp.]